MPKSDRERERVTVVEVEGGPEEGLPDLVGRLGENVVELVDSKLGLLKVELDEAARAYAAGAIELAIAAIVALVGFALSATALAFALVYLFPEGWLDPSLNRALAFGMVGSVALVTGVVFTLRGRAHFASSQANTALTSRIGRQATGDGAQSASAR